MKRTVVIPLALSLLACDDPARPVPMETTLSFTTLFNDEVWFLVSETTLTTFTSQDDAADFLREFSTNIPASMARILTLVDYDTHMSLIVAPGARPHTNYIVTIIRVVSTGSEIVVHAVEDGHTFGERTITYPLHVIRLRKSELPIKLVMSRKCNGSTENTEDCFP